jgi:hypothetical protein
MNICVCNDLWSVLDHSARWFFCIWFEEHEYIVKLLFIIYIMELSCGFLVSLLELFLAALLKYHWLIRKCMFKVYSLINISMCHVLTRVCVCVCVCVCVWWDLWSTVLVNGNVTNMVHYLFQLLTTPSIRFSKIILLS